MRLPQVSARMLAVALGLAASLLVGSPPVVAQTAAPAAQPASAPAKAALDNKGCLDCHGEKKKLEVADAGGKKRTLVAVPSAAYADAVHGKMQCVDCHADIADNQSPHQKTGAPTPSCAGCHDKLFDDLQKAGKDAQRPRMGVIDKNIDAYRKSFHARQNKDKPGHPNADCHECHDTHVFNVPTERASRQYIEWRRGIPQLCGKCHDEQLESYQSSVHGKQIADKTDGKGATCIDCHTTHEITGTSLASFKLLIPEECGECHKANLKSYRDTYHGQSSQLGYVPAAKCFDCHGSHEIQKIDDPESMVHADNRLKTCKSCHDGKKRPEATAGFVSFSPHAHAGDFKKYPEMWIASKFMIGLLIAVFAFFWLHCLLWYYREWKDRKEGKPRQRVLTLQMELDPTRKQVRRFGLGWRIGHLAFALVTMTLVLTGTAALYSHTGWARATAVLMGGANNLGLIHRVAAALFVGIFLVHFVYVMWLLLVKKRGRFRWFGPDSLVPRWQDLWDIIGMFKWFLGKGPRPQFDRWAYYEKFDYWAVFWGVNIIGWSGLMLALPHVTAQFLPGWIFNVATLVHGEEAFLAAVFLFTVHFFNNHFRPDKLPPPDIVMFTGSQTIEEFRHDHPAQYNRLVESGELQKYLVDTPSPAMTLGSKLLGMLLIVFGLTLLLLVGIGFFSSF